MPKEDYMVDELNDEADDSPLKHKKDHVMENLQDRQSTKMLWLDTGTLFLLGSENVTQSKLSVKL